MRHEIASYFRRHATTIALSVITISVLSVFFLLVLAVAKQNQQLVAQNKVLNETRNITQQINSNSEANKQQIADLNRHLDCIVLFFGIKNRTNKSIEDIDSCRITGSFPTSPTTFTPSKSTSQSPTITKTESNPQPSSQTNTSNNTTTNTPPANAESAPCVLTLLGLKVGC